MIRPYDQGLLEGETSASTLEVLRCSLSRISATIPNVDEVPTP